MARFAQRLVTAVRRPFVPGVFALAAVVASAPGVGAAVITQSTSQTITPGNSIACIGGTTTREASYYRSFDLTSFAGAGNAFLVNSVSFGVEFVDTVYPLTVNLYTDSDGGAPGSVGTDLTLIGTANYNTSPADNGMVVSVPIAALAPADSFLVMEVFAPNTGTAAFFIGSNAAGQTGPSFLRAPDCGVGSPTDLAGLGFPNMHLVFNINGDVVPQTEAPVPEPATLAVFGVMGVCGLVVRRRKNAAA